MIPGWIFALLTHDQQMEALRREVVDGEVFFRRGPKGGIIIVPPEEIEEARAMGPKITESGL